MTDALHSQRLGECLVGDIVRFPDGAVARTAWPGRDPVKKGSGKKGEIAGWFLEFREEDFGGARWGEPRWFDGAAIVDVLESPNSRVKPKHEAAEDLDDPLLRQTESRRKARHNPNQENLP